MKYKASKTVQLHNSWLHRCRGRRNKQKCFIALKKYYKSIKIEFLFHQDNVFILRQREPMRKFCFDFAHVCFCCLRQSLYLDTKKFVAKLIHCLCGAINSCKWGLKLKLCRESSLKHWLNRAMINNWRSINSIDLKYITNFKCLYSRKINSRRKKQANSTFCMNDKNKLKIKFWMFIMFRKWKCPLSDSGLF
jgi:hypothetical protein